MTAHLRVLGFAGSLRQASYNRSLLRASNREVASGGVSPGGAFKQESSQCVRADRCELVW